MGKYFGTDGFRGEANVDLTADHAFRVGRFLGWYYNIKRPAGSESAKILIGKDTRRSSYMFEYALAAGITASGADAYLLHVTTTPSVAYVTRMDDFDCGVMISASHNPFYDNGIKIVNSRGEKIDDAMIEMIERYIDGETESLVEGEGLVEILGGDGHVGVAQALDDVVGHGSFSFHVYMYTYMIADECTLV